MMFDLLHTLPKSCYVAVSGGVDSMAVLHWLNKFSNRILGVLHLNCAAIQFDHEAHELVRRYCQNNNLCFISKVLKDVPPAGESKEKWWRDQRYSFFAEHSGTDPVIIAHNFDDCLEEYIMNTMVRGYSATIPYAHGNCIRPFRLWKRSSISEYAQANDVPYMEDPMNRDLKCKRNFIRHAIVPEIKKLNPGVYNIVEKLIRENP